MKKIDAHIHMHTCDMEKAKEYRTKLTEQQKQIEKFCKDNNLRRQTEREMVQEEY